MASHGNENASHTMSSSTKSAVITLLDGIGAPDLTLQVTIPSHRPLFNGTFSDVYQGIYEKQFVCIILIIRNSFLSDDVGCR
jgi:hypothetical protein